jgi:hypothetical protein
VSKKFPSISRSLRTHKTPTILNPLTKSIPLTPKYAENIKTCLVSFSFASQENEKHMKLLNISEEFNAKRRTSKRNNFLSKYIIR